MGSDCQYCHLTCHVADRLKFTVIKALRVENGLEPKVEGHEDRVMALLWQHLYNRVYSEHSFQAYHTWCTWEIPSKFYDVTIYLEPWLLKQTRDADRLPLLESKTSLRDLIGNDNKLQTDQLAGLAACITDDLCFPPSLGLATTVGTVLEGMHLLWGGKAVRCKGCEGCGYADITSLIAQPEVAQAGSESFTTTTFFSTSIAYCIHCWCDFLFVVEVKSKSQETLRRQMLNGLMVRFSDRLSVLHEYSSQHWWDGLQSRRFK